MNMLAPWLSLGSLLTGIAAAFFWFMAGRKTPYWQSLRMVTAPDDLMDLYWKLREVHHDAVVSARFNRIAALWTAASVSLAGAASFASLFVFPGSN